MPVHGSCAKSVEFPRAPSLPPPPDSCFSGVIFERTHAVGILLAKVWRAKGGASFLHRCIWRSTGLSDSRISAVAESGPAATWQSASLSKDKSV